MNELNAKVNVAMKIAKEYDLITPTGAAHICKPRPLGTTGDEISLAGQVKADHLLWIAELKEVGPTVTRSEEDSRSAPYLPDASCQCVFVRCSEEGLGPLPAM